MKELHQAQDEALQLYLDGTLSDSEICSNLNLAPALLRSWIKDGEWATKRNEAEADIIARSNTQFKKHIAKKRLETAKRHLNIASMIEDQIKKRIEEAEDPSGNSPLAGIPISMRDLRDMSQALKTAADTSARAVVLTERESEYNGSFRGEGDGIRRLINVNIMPIGPAQSTPAINITSEVVVEKLKPIDIPDPF